MTSDDSVGAAYLGTKRYFWYKDRVEIIVAARKARFVSFGCAWLGRLLFGDIILAK